MRECGCVGKRGERKKRARDEAEKKGVGKGADIHQLSPFVT